MATKLISFVCEGPHDVAFINRMLKAEGFRTHEKIKIGEYPFPMGRLFEKSLRRSDFRQLNFSEARQAPLPSHALKSGETFVFLYALGGDSRKAERVALLQQMATFIQNDPQEIQILPADTSLTIIMMFDADDLGVEKRVERMRVEIAEALAVRAEEIAIGRNGDICKANGLSVGCFVLTNQDSEKGRLEDVLLPIMRDGNECIFDAADSFLDAHFEEERTKFLQIRPTDTGLSETRSNDVDFDRKKSLIGVVAQLQISGKPNQACINRTDYLNMEKLVTNPHCAPIREFLAKALAM